MQSRTGGGVVEEDVREGLVGRGPVAGEVMDDDAE